LHAMARRNGRHCSAPTACVPRALRHRWDKTGAAKAAADKAAADKAAAEKAAAEKVAAEKRAAEKVAAERAAAERAAAERAAAERAAAEKAAAERVAAERAKAAADKAAADKAAADKAAADKAAADKAAAAQDAATEPQDSIRAMLSRLAAAQGAASEQQDTLRAMLERLGLRFDGPAPEPAPTTAPPGDWKTRKLFEVPGTITEQMTQGVKDQVLSQLPEGVPFENFYPEAVISYASGKRPQDCAGAGPGMYYAADLVKLLNGRGVQCFSGLHVPPGKDWKTFMLRLEGHRARAKVLIVVLTKALFESKPCLDEIHTAVKKGITLLPIYFEEALPSKPNQWTKFIKDDDLELMVLDVQKQLGKINGIPHPGTVFTVPDAMHRILIEVEKHVGAQRELRSAVSAGHHGVNDYQV
jgi:hypothetical protein